MAGLESERLRTAEYLEQMKKQGELLRTIMPSPAARQPEGTIDADGKSGYVAELVSYQALKKASQEIVRRITVVDGLSKDARILVVDHANYAAGDLPLIEISQQFGLAEGRCRKQVADNRDLLDWVMQKEEKAEGEVPAMPREASQRFAFFAAVPAIAAAATALPAFSGLIGTVADIAGYFRADYAMKGKATGKTESLVASVAGSLRTEKRSIFLYNFASLDTIGTQSKLIKTYTGLLDCSSRLAKTRNQLSYFIGKKTSRLAELRHQLACAGQQAGQRSQGPGESPETLREKIAEETSWLNLANPALLASDAIHAELASYIKSITTAETPDTVPKLAQAMFRERIADLGITHLLYLGVNSCGGEVVTKRFLFLFTTQSFFGGCVTSFVLARKEGEILVSDTTPILCVVDFRLFDNWIGPLHQVRFDRPEMKK